MTHDAEYQVKSVIPRLVGGKITGAVMDMSKEFFGFTVEKEDKTFTVWVDADEEGNHCGVLQIEEEKP